MSFTLTDEQQAIRDAIFKLLDPGGPLGDTYWLERDREGGFPHEFFDAIAEAGWLGIAMPEAYGGAGLGITDAAVLMQAIAESGAGMTGASAVHLNIFGLNPVVVFGTDAQKQRWLTEILPARQIWCQLFSEPGAGSDLAAVATKAQRTEGGWILDGQKVWTSYAQFADWGLCLARTNPDVAKQQGISAFAIDMRAPGVEVRPLRQITDEAEFNEVFFSEVFVPDEQLIGPEHEGWRVANSTLTHERGVNPRQLVIHIQLLEELLRLAEEAGAFDDPRLAPRLGQAAAEVRLFQLHNWRTLSRVAKGQPPGPEGSALKLYWSEMSKRLHETVMAVLAETAPLWFGATENPGGGTWQRSWLYYQASSIWAGTNEIQRNILSERVLGLPRDPK